MIEVLEEILGCLSDDRAVNMESINNHFVNVGEVITLGEGQLSPDVVSNALDLIGKIETKFQYMHLVSRYVEVTRDLIHDFAS